MATVYRSKKYMNRKSISDDGIRFDSKKEMIRYYELRAMQKCGMISDLKLQPEYVLIPNMYSGKKCIFRGVKYKADFTYYDEFGNFVCEDVKGFRTKEYIIKRKLMYCIHGILVKEV